MSKANESTTSSSPFPNPFANFSKMFEQFKMPGVDMTAMMAERRKDIEAVVAVNKSAYEAMQALGKKQTEMMQETMQGLQQAASSAAANATSGKGFGDAQTQTVMARAGFEKALADMKELAEIARKSQADAMAIMTQRASQQMLEIQKMMNPK